MTYKYNIDSGLDGVNGFGLIQGDLKYSTTLAASTEATLTVTGADSLGNFQGGVNRFVALFSYEPGANVYVSINGTAEVPAGGTLAATTSELNPTARQVNAGDVISIISAGTPDVQISIYSL